MILPCYPDRRVLDQSPRPRRAAGSIGRRAGLCAGAVRAVSVLQRLPPRGAARGGASPRREKDRPLHEGRAAGRREPLARGAPLHGHADLLAPRESARSRRCFQRVGFVCEMGHRPVGAVRAGTDLELSRIGHARRRIHLYKISPVRLPGRVSERVLASECRGVRRA